MQQITLGRVRRIYHHIRTNLESTEVLEKLLQTLTEVIIAEDNIMEMTGNRPHLARDDLILGPASTASLQRVLNYIQSKNGQMTLPLKQQSVA